MDVTAMPLSDATCDVVLEKCVMDCFACALEGSEAQP